MSSQAPPNPNFTGIDYNGSFFMSNTGYITLAYANSHYLSRVGIASSIASQTTFSGKIIINDNTASTTTTTGALIVAGGIGMGGALVNGGGIVTAGQIFANNTGDSTSDVSGSIIVAGGVGVAKQIVTGSNIILSTGGTYLQFPDGSRQTTAATSSALSKYYAYFTAVKSSSSQFLLYFNWPSTSWSVNDYFVIKYDITINSNYNSGNGEYQNTATYSGYMQMYPERILGCRSDTSGANSKKCLLNNSINGNSSFVMTDSTYAVDGRWYWTYAYADGGYYSTAGSGTFGTCFMILAPDGGSDGTNIGFQIINPFFGQAQPYCTVTATAQLINPGAGSSTITTTGFTSNFVYP